jgi:hypothetical protein
MEKVERQRRAMPVDLLGKRIGQPFSAPAARQCRQTTHLDRSSALLNEPIGEKLIEI